MPCVVIASRIFQPTFVDQIEMVDRVTKMIMAKVTAIVLAALVRQHSQEDRRQSSSIRPEQIWPGSMLIRFIIADEETDLQDLLFCRERPAALPDPDDKEMLRTA